MKTDIKKSPLPENASKRSASSHSFLRALSGSVSDAVIITDKKLIIEYWNKEASRVFGLNESEAVGRHISDILFPNFNSFSFEEIIRQLSEKEKYEEQILADKKKIDCTFFATGIYEEEETGLLIICKEHIPTSDLLNEKKQLPFNDRRAEKEIILSEQKLRAVLNNSIGAIFLLDTFYRVILANEKAIKIVSLATNGSELKEGTYFPDLLPKNRRTPAKEILDRVLKGEKIEYEIYYPTESGNGIWLMATYTPVRNNYNDVNQICVTAYNITSRKENEAALIKSEQRWKFALDGAGDGVWEYNFQTKEIYYSPIYKNMLGYSEDEFPNKAYEWQSRVHPDDFYKIIDVDTLYEDHSLVNHSVEYRLRSKSGEFVWVLDRGMLLERTPDGKPLKLIGTHTNITERKIAEEKLKQSEHRFASFMANTPTMAWIIDEHGVFRYLNASYKRSFRLTEDAVGKSVYEFFPVAICDRFIENNRKVFEMNRAIELTEEGVGPDGMKQIYHIYKFPLEPENGTRLLGGVALDITKKVQLEQQLAEDESRKKRQIIEAIINAQEKERIELAYELHDNVNQILSSSKLMLEVAAEKPGLSKDFTKRGLGHLQEAINEIRKISHNLTPASLRDISLEAAVEDVVQTINATGKLKIKYSDKTATIKKDLAPEKQLAILRIIQEQFNNILKHADASEATISIEADEHLLLLEIADNGRGFDPSTTKKGLGLNNMFNRVAHYNGLIELISSDGKGCTLQVKIPT
ncbi:MAG: PAS domain S-box protein [Chitinophagaceae bacterium]